MKKTRFLAAFLAVLCCVGCFAFVGCNCEHVWNEGEITTPATVDADGVKTFTCTKCGETRTEAVVFVATVTEEEWAQAFAFEAIENYVMTASSPDVAEASTIVINKNGNKAFLKQTYGSNERLIYLVNENGSYYMYNNDMQGYGYEKYEVNEENYISNISQGLGEIFKFADFTYDEESKAYTAAEIVWAFEGGNTLTLTNVSVQFSDKKLVFASFQTTAGGISGTMQYSVSYGNAEEVVIPEDKLRPEDQLIVMEDGTYAYWYFNGSGQPIQYVMIIPRYINITLPNGSKTYLGKLNTELRLLCYVEIGDGWYVFFDHTTTSVPVPPQGDVATVYTTDTMRALILSDGTIKTVYEIPMQVVELPSGEMVYFHDGISQEQIELPDGTFATVRRELVGESGQPQRSVHMVELPDGTILESQDFSY